MFDQYIFRSPTVLASAVPSMALSSFRPYNRGLQPFKSARSPSIDSLERDARSSSWISHLFRYREQGRKEVLVTPRSGRHDLCDDKLVPERHLTANQISKAFSSRSIVRISKSVLPMSPTKYPRSISVTANWCITWQMYSAGE